MAPTHRLTVEAWEALCGALPRALLKRHSFMIGTGRAFAVWATNGDQVGPHLRSNDPTLRSDARVRRSTLQIPTIELKNHFVYLNPKADWPLEHRTGYLPS
jgi:hypothetical protein